MKTRIQARKGLGSLSSFSFLVDPSNALKSSNGEQLTDDEVELLKQIKSSYSSHTPRRNSWPANH